MNNKAKPPMVATLNNMGTGIVKPGEYYDKHIYVNLDQFLAEVDKRAEKLFGQSFHTATQADCFHQVVRELAKEIMEGKG